MNIRSGITLLTLIITCFFVAFSFAGFSQFVRKEYPVIPGDFADPSIIRNGNTYFATGTSSEWAPHYPIYQSGDMLNWKQVGYVFRTTPAWASASFWAPELLYRNGIYYLYYVARRKADGISCIGVATSKDPLKGFTDHGILVDFGKEAIDPFVIEDDDKLYITWKAYGLDQRPIEILASRLSDDGLKLEGEPFMLLRDDNKKGLEGQCIVKHNGYFYIFYSLGNCCGRECSYEVDVARAEKIEGPYIKSSHNPMLSETAEWKCSGHGTLVTSQSGEDLYMYHAYNKKEDVYTGRQAMLARLNWNNETGWPSFSVVSGKPSSIKNFKDDFSGSRLSGQWQWDFRNASPKLNLSDGRLTVSGSVTSENLSGIALTIRPVCGDYEIITSADTRNEGTAGLTIYGDAGQAVGIGVGDGKLSVWEVKDKKRTILNEELMKPAIRMQLKVTVKEGHKINFFWSANGSTWYEIKTGAEFYNGDFLPPWDRSPRPGVYFQGPAESVAVFDFFEIRYMKQEFERK